MGKDTKIKKTWAYSVFDSTGSPTIEVVIELEDGTRGRGSAPRGETVGDFECVQKYDSNPSFGNYGVLELCRFYNNNLSNELIGLDVSNIFLVDDTLIDIDNTGNKSSLGGNLTLSISIAAVEALVNSLKIPLYRLINSQETYKRPLMMFNILDGTKETLVPGVECLLVEKNKQNSIYETLEKSSYIQKTLEEIIVKANGVRGYGNQGSCIDNTLKSPEEMMIKVDKALTKAGLKDEFTLGLDLATADSYKDGEYKLTWTSSRTGGRLTEQYKQWIETYNLTYLEDLYSDTDYETWKKHISEDREESMMIVGDDLYASNPIRIKKYDNLANSVVIKPNQIGTIKETVESIKIAKELNYKTIISQRTSEIESNIITQIAVACGVDYIKAGGMRRMDRVSKYNELIRIFEDF